MVCGTPSPRDVVVESVVACVRLTPVAVSVHDIIASLYTCGCGVAFVRLTPVAVTVYDTPSYGCGGVVVLVRLTSVVVSVHDTFAPVYGCGRWG